MYIIPSHTHDQRQWNMYKENIAVNYTTAEDFMRKLPKSCKINSGEGNYFWNDYKGTILLQPCSRTRVKQ